MFVGIMFSLLYVNISFDGPKCKSFYEKKLFKTLFVYAHFWGRYKRNIQLEFWSFLSQFFRRRTWCIGSNHFQQCVWYQMHLKVGLSPSKKLFYLLHWKPFKNDEKCFLFHIKSYFRSQDIYNFALNYWSCGQYDLIRKIRLIL